MQSLESWHPFFETSNRILLPKPQNEVALYFNCENCFCRTKDAVFNDDDNSIRFFIRGRPVTLFAPTEVAANFSLNKVLPAPSAKPRLEWVYG